MALTFVQVARTVAFVRSSSLLLSIRAGGPSTSGPARELNSPFNRPSQPLISTPQAVFILHLSPRSCPRCSSLPPATGIRPPTGAPDCPARSGSSSKNRSPSLAPVSSSPCSFFPPRPGRCQSILTSAHPTPQSSLGLGLPVCRLAATTQPRVPTAPGSEAVPVWPTLLLAVSLTCVSAGCVCRDHSSLPTTGRHLGEGWKSPRVSLLASAAAASPPEPLGACCPSPGDPFLPPFPSPTLSFLFPSPNSARPSLSLSPRLAARHLTIASRPSDSACPSSTRHQHASVTVLAISPAAWVCQDGPSGSAAAASAGQTSRRSPPWPAPPHRWSGPSPSLLSFSTRLRPASAQHSRAGP